MSSHRYFSGCIFFSLVKSSTATVSDKNLSAIASCGICRWIHRLIGEIRLILLQLLPLWLLLENRIGLLGLRSENLSEMI